MKYYPRLEKLLKNNSSSNLVFSSIIVLVWVFFTRNILLANGDLCAGDFLPFSARFAGSTSYAWYDFEHLGVPSLSFIFHSPYFLFFGKLSGIIGQEISSKLYMLLPLLVASLSMYIFLCYLMPDALKSSDNRGMKRLACVIGALTYAYNPWVVARVVSGHGALLYGYSLFPLLFLFSTRSLLKGFSTKYSLLTGIIWGLLLCTVPHMAILGMIGYLIFLTLCYFLYRISMREIVLHLIVTGSIGIVLSAFWLLPYFFIYTSRESANIAAQSNQTYDWLYQNAQLINTFRLASSWGTALSQTVHTRSLGSTLYILYIMSSFTMPLVAISVILINKQRKSKDKAWLIYWFAVVLFVSFSLLSSDMVRFLNLAVMKIKFLGIANQLFREPDKFNALTSFSCSVLVFFFICAILEMRKRKYRFILVGLILLLGMSNWIWFTGDLNGLVKPIKMPSERAEMYAFIDSIKQDDYRILNIPSSGYVGYKWYQSWWNEEGLLGEPLRFQATLPLVGPPYDRSVSTNPRIEDFIESVNNKDNVRNLLRFAAEYMNARYIVLSGDCSPGFDDMVNKQSISIRAMGNEVKPIFKYDGTEVFELNSSRAHVFAAKELVLVPVNNKYAAFSLPEEVPLDTIDAFLEYINKDLMGASTTILPASKVDSERFNEAEFQYDSGTKNSLGSLEYLKKNKNITEESSREDTSQVIVTAVKLNPTKYRVSAKSDKPFFLVFSETYHPGWEAFIESGGRSQKREDEMRYTPSDALYLFKKPIDENKHFLVNGYANAWYIDPKKVGKNDFTVTLYFRPQSYSYIGLIISVTTLLGCVGYLVWYWWKRRKRKSFISKTHPAISPDQQSTS